MARNQKSVVLPFATYDRLSQTKFAESAALYTRFRQAEREFLDIAMERWLDGGGCRHCLGRGWTVVWDTLESMSGCYAEYGDCPSTDCTIEGRRVSGLAPTYSKYDRNRGVPDPIGTLPAYVREVLPLRDAAERLETEAKILQRKSEPRRGSLVVVTSGRKLPLASTWRVAFIHDNGGLLLKDAAAWEDRKKNGTWVNSGNVEVIADA